MLWGYPQPSEFLRRRVKTHHFYAGDIVKSGVVSIVTNTIGNPADLAGHTTQMLAEPLPQARQGREIVESNRSPRPATRKALPFSIRGGCSVVFAVSFILKGSINTRLSTVAPARTISGVIPN
jgi:hypothetical protein